MDNDNDGNSDGDNADYDADDNDGDKPSSQESSVVKRDNAVAWTRDKHNNNKNGEEVVAEEHLNWWKW